MMDGCSPAPDSPEVREIARLRAEINALRKKEFQLEKEAKILKTNNSPTRSPKPSGFMAGFELKSRNPPTPNPKAEALSDTSPLVPDTNELRFRFRKLEETLNEAAPTSPRKCSRYRVDLTADRFGICKCGRKKSEHEDVDGYDAPRLAWALQPWEAAAAAGTPAETISPLAVISSLVPEEKRQAQQAAAKAKASSSPSFQAATSKNEAQPPKQALNLEIQNAVLRKTSSEPKDSASRSSSAGSGGASSASSASAAQSWRPDSGGGGSGGGGGGGGGLLSEIQQGVRLKHVAPATAAAEAVASVASGNQASDAIKGNQVSCKLRVQSRAIKGNQGSC